MRRQALGKHGCSILLGLLLSLSVGGSAHAAPNPSPVQIAIGSPTPDALVGGRITLSIAYSSGMTRISAFTVYVDDSIHFSRSFIGLSTRGIQYLELDTRSIPDGNHTLRVAAMGPRGSLSVDAVDIVVRNGVMGGMDTVPPLVQFRGLIDGQTVWGNVTVDVLAEDNTTSDLLVSIFVNQRARLIRNRPPYTLDLSTSDYLDALTGLGTIRLDAWAYDRAENVGKARPITLNVRPAPTQNATPKQEDPLLPRVGSMPPPFSLKPNLGEPMKHSVEGEPVFPTPRGSGPGARSESASPSSEPGTRPAPMRVAKGFASPDFQAVGSAAGQSLSDGSRSRVPYPARPSVRAAQPRSQATAPDLVSGEADEPSLSGSRTAAPPPGAPRDIRSRPAGPARIVRRPGARVIPAARQNPTASPGGARAAVPPGLPASSRQVASAAVKPPDSEIIRSPEGPGGSLVVRMPERVPGDAGTPVEVQPATPVDVRPAQAGAPPVARPPASRRVGPRRAAAPRVDLARGSQPDGPAGQPFQQIASSRIRPGSPEMVDDTFSDPNLPTALETDPIASPGGPRFVLPVPSPAALASRPPAAQPIRAARASRRARPVRMAKAAAASTPQPRTGPLVVVVDKNEQPGSSGKVSAEVYQLSPRALLPKDRSYRVQRGDTLDVVAKKFGVTSKSLLVANALGGRGVRAGSIIKVPGTFDVVMNDQRIAFDVSPRVENGLSLAPFRQIFEFSGGVVVWYPDTREIRAANEQAQVRLRIGSKEALYNQTVVVMEREAFLDSGRTIVPISFMEKVLDLKAEYDVKTGAIVLAPK
jgi:LysM repeat protein